MDEIKYGSVYSAVKEWFRYTSIYAPGIMDKYTRKVKLPKVSRFESTGHTNCKYCRKRCKLFHQNKCYEKSSEDQMKCEYYKG